LILRAPACFVSIVVCQPVKQCLRTLQSGGVLSTATEQKHRLLVLELRAQLLDALVELEDVLELCRYLAETLHDV